MDVVIFDKPMLLAYGFFVSFLLYSRIKKEAPSEKFLSQPSRRYFGRLLRGIGGGVFLGLFVFFVIPQAFKSALSNPPIAWWQLILNGIVMTLTMFVLVVSMLIISACLKRRSSVR
ncbi:hypothetical protein IDSA_06545 [Pseudidiomarina salinarum]|uniref:Uncharacterized protein n=1 Tax=Pseudidiomarina salinarum TaxID=435908 RepID=A0A094IVH8_9GAMM|nr:hypothetical protein [Pseudidiomarina salinarum]KFZ31132.1 hypothetical protein IDSA_06545 [Pseudidiomarina salinarum]RUO71215.1 hypothetical protein CWI79_07240 [Pseudidiomarina salinarum]